MNLQLFLLFNMLLLLQKVLPAQSLLNQKAAYSRADTLRGSLRPERTCYDVTYYDLSVKIDTTEKSITGTNTMQFTATENFEWMQIDLFENMKIISITSNGKELRYRREYNAVFVELASALHKGEQSTIQVAYYGQPTIAKRPPWDGGFTWSYDNKGNNWIAVSCEGMGASSWWPCKDYLGDEPDSMRISCTVPANLRCVANGREEPEELKADNTKTYHWLVSYPINNYNVSLNIGDYVSFHDEYLATDNTILSLDYYVLRYNLEKAKLHFTQVKPMLKCYEKYLGKYPFWEDGYALVETPYLGMEHQSAIAYGNKYLTGYAGNDYSRIGLDFDYIIIHESGHEWWGNSVSCKDIADMWIHESFCTYSESIYVECMFGKDTALKYINAHKANVRNQTAIVGNYGVNEEGSGDMYAKGALFLNTLRSITDNDELWWRTIKKMSDTTFKMSNIGYSDVVSFFNSELPVKAAPIFEQYLKYPKIPVFEYSLAKIKKGTYKLTYRWLTDVADFEMPVFYTAGNNTKLKLNTKNVSQTVVISLKRENLFKVMDNLEYIDVRKI